MNQILVVITIIILMVYLINLIIRKTKRSAYKKAAKKWDGIVKELSERK
tara:strand:- start:234 stop:380 length:147 start_codon:yes stop_codon:yes gene_type:complete